MRIPLDSVVSTVRLGASVQGDVDAPVRVAVYVGSSATPFLIDAVRRAFVPQRTTALVRVERLGAEPLSPKADTDVALVLSCGGAALQARVQELVVAGVPTAVLCESSVEVPFIHEDTRMLGLIAATDQAHLLTALAHWILERTEKDTAFASNFPFMRMAAARGIVNGAALGNAATGALFFIPGADFPVMTAAQLGMMLRLSAVFGKPLRAERAYEGAAVVAAALALRAGARAASRRLGYGGFLFKALVGGAGTYAMGRALTAFYESDFDYSSLNDAVLGTVGRVKDLVAPHEGPARA